MKHIIREVGKRINENSINLNAISDRITGKDVNKSNKIIGDMLSTDLFSNRPPSSLSFDEKIEKAKKTDDLMDTTYGRGSVDGAVAGGAAVGLGIVGAVGAYKLIKTVYDHYKWKSEGCKQLQDPHKKLDCEMYIKNNVLKALSVQLNKCKDEECRSKIKQEISKHS